MKNQDGSTRTYLQLVESRRINGKPRQIVLLTLGRTDTKQGKENIRKVTHAILKNSSEFTLFNPEKHISFKAGQEYGPFLIFKNL